MVLEREEKETVLGWEKKRGRVREGTGRRKYFLRTVPKCGTSPSGNKAGVAAGLGGRQLAGDGWQ